MKINKKGMSIKYLDGTVWRPGVYLEYIKGGKEKIWTQMGIKVLPSWKIDMGGKKAKKRPRKKIIGKPFWKM